MTTTADRFVEQAVEAFRRHLHGQIEAHGVPDVDPEVVARRAALETTSSRSWNDDLGPFYDTAGAQVMLGGVTKQAVSQRVQAGRLLGLRLALERPGHPRRVYPAWQFRPNVLPHLPAVLTAAGFDDERPVTGWTVAHWFVNAVGDDPCPLELLGAGHVDHVLRLAHEVSESLGAQERLIG